MTESSYSKYQPNSHKYKEEQAKKEKSKEKPKQVAKAKSVDKKEDKMEIAKERVSNAGTAVVNGVLIPALKKLIVEAVTSGIRSIVFPNEPAGGRKYSNYDRPSYRDTESRVIRTEERRRVRKEIIMETEEDAESVIDALSDLIDRYERASIADLYDLVGITAEYTDHRYGWTSIRNFGVARNRYGEYEIKAPRAVLLD